MIAYPKTYLVLIKSLLLSWLILFVFAFVALAETDCLIYSTNFNNHGPILPSQAKGEIQIAISSFDPIKAVFVNGESKPIHGLDQEKITIPFDVSLSSQSFIVKVQTDSETAIKEFEVLQIEQLATREKLIPLDLTINLGAGQHKLDSETKDMTRLMISPKYTSEFDGGSKVVLGGLYYASESFYKMDAQNIYTDWLPKVSALKKLLIGLGRTQISYESETTQVDLYLKSAATWGYRFGFIPAKESDVELLLKATNKTYTDEEINAWLVKITSQNIFEWGKFKYYLTQETETDLVYRVLGISTTGYFSSNFSMVASYKVKTWETSDSDLKFGTNSLGFLVLYGFEQMENLKIYLEYTSDKATGDTGSDSTSSIAGLMYLY